MSWVHIVALWATLLLVGGFVGYRLARGRYKYRLNVGEPANVAMQRDYLRCLNFLINDQQDKAVELFTDLVEVDTETVETHLALGNLFRRRGEVDRALRVHQNVVARPDLRGESRGAALLELARDYQGAGMLDRAESVFLDLAQSGPHALAALQSLVSIYEHQKDWDRAIQVTRRISTSRDTSLSRKVSHYYCELAAEASSRHEWRLARQQLKQAQQADKVAVRPWMLSAVLDARTSEHGAGLRSIRRAIELRGDLLGWFLPTLLDCLPPEGKRADIQRFLSRQNSSSKSAAMRLAYVEFLHAIGDVDQANSALQTLISSEPSPTLLIQAIGIVVGTETAVLPQQLDFVRESWQGMRLSESKLRCTQCGFEGATLHWQCPSCKQWDQQRPVLDIDG